VLTEISEIEMSPDQLFTRKRSLSRGRGQWRAALVAAVCVGGLLTACSGGSTGSGSGAAFGTTGTWNETWSKNVYSPNYYSGLAANWALLQFGYAIPSTNRTHMFDVIPELMSSFSVDASNLATIHLRPNLKFADGSKLDATDVKKTWLLQSAFGLGYQINIKSMTVKDPTTIEVQFYKEVADVNVRGSIIAMRPLPMTVYGKFVVPGLEKAITDYNAQYRGAGGPTAANKSSAYTLIKNDYNDMVKFEPKTFVGDGPFTIKNVNTAQATLVKSPTFYAADKVHIPKITMTNATTTSNIFPLLFSHKLDWYASVEDSATILDRWKHTTDAHTVLVTNNKTEEIDFNNKKYPFTIKQVRQAIAHVIDRKNLVATETGGTSVNKAIARPDGLDNLLNGTWLDKQDMTAMDSYNHDTGQAAQLLKSVGFTKSGKTWMMPNGKPFKTQMLAPSTPGAAVIAAREVAAELSDFGIPTTASAIQAAGYPAQIGKGDFAMGYNTGVNGNLEPICGIANGGLGASGGLALPDNYAYGGANTGPGIGFGPNVNVPGVGNVMVSQTIDQQCQYTDAGSTMASLTTAWATLVNKQMPYLTYADDTLVARYSTANYTKWPAANSKYWQEAITSPVQAFIWMIEDGYVAPK
jgi:peptide/nickel transport system substrate-binding protein